MTEGEDVPGAQAPAVATVPATRVADLVRVIQSAYEEMPDLCLTRNQIRRLWLLDPTACDNVLRAMVDAGFLRITAGGYVRG